MVHDVHQSGNVHQHPQSNSLRSWVDCLSAKKPEGMADDSLGCYCFIIVGYVAVVLFLSDALSLLVKYTPFVTVGSYIGTVTDGYHSLSQTMIDHR